MNKIEADQVIKEVKAALNKMTEYSENAQSVSFLSYYNNAPDFLHISSDGNMRNYEEFSRICSEYYTALESQEIFTVSENLNIIDTGLVISGWTGNITARFKNGDTMIMNNYSVSNLFKKINGEWKIIHSHESALPPEFIKKS